MTVGVKRRDTMQNVHIKEMMVVVLSVNKKIGQRYLRWEFGWLWHAKLVLY